jgi:pimeloyl-ACP methyl ester carboxylesterase
MSAALSHHHQDLGDVALHFVRAGQGEPVVLLHGWPQTWYAWRKTSPALAQHHTVIAPDLRGLGDSSRPQSGVRQTDHRRRHLATGPRASGLSHGSCWSATTGAGPVAYAIAARHPDAVRRLVMLDTGVPGDGSGTFSQHGRRWHHAFHQTPDLPEALIARSRGDLLRLVLGPLRLAARGDFGRGQG